MAGAKTLNTVLVSTPKKQEDDPRGIVFLLSSHPRLRSSSRHEYSLLDLQYVLDELEDPVGEGPLRKVGASHPWE